MTFSPPGSSLRFEAPRFPKGEAFMLGRSFEMLINSSDFNIGKHKFLALSRTNLSLEED